MKHEPRPTIHMEKQLGLAHKLGGMESLGISKTGQTVLARLMESQIWHQPVSYVEGGFRKGTMASAHLSVRKNAVPQLSPWCQTLQFLPVCHWCLSSCYPGAGGSEVGGSESKPVCGFFKGNCLGLQKFLPLTQSPLIFAARSCGVLSSCH